MFPWIVETSTPRSSSYPDSPHIYSNIPIRTTLDKVLKQQGRKLPKSEVELFAIAVMEKIQEMMAGSNSSCMFLLFFFSFLFIYLFFFAY